ncbi:frg1-like motif-containing protein [Pandoravirus inopinatum]|uniref:Frg1-like motif-containing protein n=1 Tax=Pandoravirus inopinatum TaxID=1605721 RepID=A0A0B5JC94_9VIRU|nr:frg1-like motif-containing protein [Pandoravirus inopinatum]AJF97202.1 frg1-like motif-containing protein [Pandoravirus inopinatum]
MKACATNPMVTTAALVTVVAIISLLALGAPTTEAYRYSVSFGASQAWSLPAGAANVSVTLWGGGGGSSTSLYCGAGGGSGATIVGRAVDASDWSISASDVVWSVVIGKGGAPSPVGAQESVAGDGGATSIIAMMPNGTVLFNATAYAGGGGKSSSRVDRTGCQGGAGGGASSSAVGPQPGGGNPSGGADNDRQAAPKEGALVGDIKAGSAGAGFGYAFDSPITRGAPWRGFGRTWSGGAGRGSTLCWSSGGAAAYGGNGGAGSNSASGSTPSRVIPTPTAAPAPVRPRPARPMCCRKMWPAPMAEPSSSTITRWRPRPLSRRPPRSRRRGRRRHRGPRCRHRPRRRSP